MQLPCTNKILQFVTELFNAKACGELARRHKFIQRSSSRLQGQEFIQLLVLPSNGLTEDSLEGLCERLRLFNPNANLSASALAQRINTAAAASMMQACFQRILKMSRNCILHQNRAVEGILGHFHAVLIQDSTVCVVNEKLQQIFQGTNRGGRGATAQMKIDLIHNFTSGAIEDAQIYSGNVPDQQLSDRILDFVQPSTLVLRDLGYFSLSILQRIAGQEAFYLSRLPPQVEVYLHLKDTAPIDIAEYVDRHFPTNAVIELDVYIGKTHRFPTRLILYKAPPHVVAERLRQAHKRAKSAGRTLSHSKKTRLKFSIFITNVSCEILPKETVGTLYRLRWEIELVFKQWKSQLKIDVLNGLNAHRIHCLIWGRLCMVVLMALVSGFFMNVAHALGMVEISPTKLILYLTRNNNLCLAVSKHRLEEFFKELLEVMSKRLLKNQRRRKTLREMVFTAESYYVERECA